MNFFRNLKYRLAAFMQGRYGMDDLYKALLKAMLVLLLLNLFFPSILFYFLFLLTGFTAFFRAFSKNHVKRAAENQKYLLYKEQNKKNFLQLKNRVRYRKTHRYRVCPNCKTVLRLPKKIGVNSVKCPVCKHETNFNIRW